MGFERLVAVLLGQTIQLRYQTCFTGTICRHEKDREKRPMEASDNKSSVAFRVIADHIRAIAFH